jgi:hypothetical protein
VKITFLSHALSSVLILIPDFDLFDLHDYCDRFKRYVKIKVLSRALYSFPVLILIPDCDLFDLHDYCDRFKRHVKIKVLSRALYSIPVLIAVLIPILILLPSSTSPFLTLINKKSLLAENFENIH